MLLLPSLLFSLANLVTSWRESLSLSCLYLCLFLPFSSSIFCMVFCFPEWFSLSTFAPFLPCSFPLSVGPLLLLSWSFVHLSPCPTFLFVFPMVFLSCPFVYLHFLHPIYLPFSSPSILNLVCAIGIARILLIEKTKVGKRWRHCWNPRLAYFSFRLLPYLPPRWESPPLPLPPLGVTTSILPSWKAR